MGEKTPKGWRWVPGYLELTDPRIARQGVRGKECVQGVCQGKRERSYYRCICPMQLRGLAIDRVDHTMNKTGTRSQTGTRRIAVLDGHTLNPGDLTWADLEQLGSVSIYERSRSHQVVPRARDAEIILTNKVPIRKDQMQQLPELRYVGVTATGYNIVDIEYARRRGIVVTNVPVYGTQSVAQFTFSLILALCHRPEAHSDAVRAGAWSRSPDFSFTSFPQVELSGKHLGIVGYGRIGRQVAKIALAFGMRVSVFSRTVKRCESAQGIEWSDLETLFETADVLTLHCPLTKETAGMVNKDSIGRMKRSAFLINTARGGLVIQSDLADALNEGRIRGAALDVLETEPPDEDNPLLSAKNALITPHLAWATREARARLMATAVENVRRYLSGDPVNVINESGPIAVEGGK